MGKRANRKRQRAGAWCWLVCSTLLLAGCYTPPPAPVVERPQPPSEKINYHIVSIGETLYSIAWRYEMDFQQLAALNQLPPPYTLHKGQRLKLAPGFTSGDVRYDTSPSSGSAAVTVNPVAGVSPGLTVTSSPVTATTVGPDDSAAGNATGSVEQPVAPRTPAPAGPSSTPSAPLARSESGVGIATSIPSPSPSGTPAKTPPAVPGGDVEVLPAEDWDWRWPVKGKVTREYDASRVFKGVNIFSSPGTAVQAAGPGVVVYAGSGLRGYGQLIILKHSDKHLSAYAHNRKLFVKENQTVKQGDRISEVGGDPANPNRLYFEIRENGKPIDPMRLLPRQ